MNQPAKILIVVAILGLLSVGVWWGYARNGQKQPSDPINVNAGNYSTIDVPEFKAEVKNINANFKAIIVEGLRFVYPGTMKSDVGPNGAVLMQENENSPAVIFGTSIDTVAKTSALISGENEQFSRFISKEEGTKNGVTFIKLITMTDGGVNQITWVLQGETTVTASYSETETASQYEQIVTSVSGE